MIKIMAALFCILFLSLPQAQADDWRAYHHGIDFVPDGSGRYWVFFSGVTNVNRDVGDEEEWTHNIYVANWGSGEQKLSPRLFAHRPGAQEPVSAAHTNDGHIMIVVEDSSHTENDVDERYGVYDSKLKPIKAYPQQISDGGHSGHVAAVGNFFVAFYSQDWVDGGGVDDLGTGYGVYAKIYDSNGNLTRSVKVAPRKREWWPMIAGSPKRALLVWQAYIPGEDFARLKAALLDPASGALTPVALPDDVDLIYYTYSVKYIPEANRFLIAGTSDDERGFAYLIDEGGKITAQLDCMPPTVREAGIAIDGNDAYLPVAEDRMMRLHTTANMLTLTGIASSPFEWAEEGSIGMPVTAGRMHWVSLDRYGLQEANFDAADFKSPSQKDLCR